MRKSGLIELIFLIVVASYMLFSENITARIISTILLLVFIIVSKLSISFKRKKLIDEIANNQKKYMSYKENNYILSLCGFTVILNAVDSITNIFNSKNGEIKINRFVDFISTIIIDEKVNIFIYTILIILGLLLIIEGLVSFAIISDDKMIFHDGTMFSFSEITKIKYREAFFSNKKIIQLRKNYDHKEIIVKLKDFEKIKDYLEVNIDL